MVDEIVVVDTGSADDSVAIARSFGACVYEQAWAGDFSQARNAGLAKVSGRWVLYIDADERLRPIARSDVEALLGRAAEVAFRAWIRPFRGATRCREYRLWRSDPRIRFEGLIHEKVAPAIRAVAFSDARPIGLCDLELDHLGYEADQEVKHRRNLPLLRAQLAAEPNNVFNWRHLGAVLAGLGESAEAEPALERAVAVVRSSQAAVSGGSLAYADLIRFRHERGGAGELAKQADACELAAEALDRYPNDPLLLWCATVIELDRGDAVQALTILDRLGAVDRAALDDTLAYDERLFGALQHDARGLCLFRLSRFADAAAAYREAQRCEPGDDQHRLRRLMCEHLASAATGSRLEVPLSGSVRVINVAGVPIRFVASDRVRARSIAGAVGALPLHHGPAGLTVTFGSCPVGLARRSCDHADGDVRAWWEGEHLLLAHGGLSCRVNDTSAVIGGDGNTVRGLRQLLPYILTHLLAEHDRFVLHAGAIERSGQVVLVLGASGSGKSTLVVGALRAGWRALADDLVVVRDRAAPEACGIGKPIAGPADVVRSSGLTGRPLDGDPRGRWLLARSPQQGWFPVVGTVVCSQSAAIRPSLQPLSSKGLVEYLLLSFLSAKQLGRLREFLPVAAAVTRRGGWTLRHSRVPSEGLSRIGDLLEQLPLRQPQE